MKHDVQSETKTMMQEEPQSKERALPCRWINSQGLGVVEVQLDEGHTHRPVLAANKDPVTDAVHKVKIPRDPVHCYLLHVCQNEKGRKKKKKRSSGAQFQSK